MEGLSLNFIHVHVTRSSPYLADFKASQTFGEGQEAVESRFPLSPMRPHRADQSQELSFQAKRQGEQAGEETSTLHKPPTLARLCPTAYARRSLLFCFKPFPNEGGNCKDHRKRGEVVRMKPRCYDAQPHRKQKGNERPTQKPTRL